MTSNVVAPGAFDVDTVIMLLAPVVREQGWSGSWEEVEPLRQRRCSPRTRAGSAARRRLSTAVAYLVGDHAAYVSGSTLRVDGGVVRSAL